MKIDLQKKLHMKFNHFIVFGEIRFPKIGLEDGVSGLLSLDVRTPNSVLQDFVISMAPTYVLSN